MHGKGEARSESRRAGSRGAGAGAGARGARARAVAGRASGPAPVAGRHRLAAGERPGVRSAGIDAAVESAIDASAEPSPAPLGSAAVRRIFIGVPGTPPAGYDVVVEAGLLGRLGALVV